MDQIVMQSRQKHYCKYLHFGIRTVKIAAYIAIALFNEGYAAIFKIMDDLNMKIGVRRQSELFIPSPTILSISTLFVRNQVHLVRIVTIIKSISVYFVLNNYGGYYVFHHLTPPTPRSLEPSHISQYISIIYFKKKILSLHLI